MRKIILVYTKYNTLFALDSKFGNILWKKNMDYYIDLNYQDKLQGIFSLERIE